jgi:hypothetical protein
MSANAGQAARHNCVRTIACARGASRIIRRQIMTRVAQTFARRLECCLPGLFACSRVTIAPRSTHRRRSSAPAPPLPILAVPSHHRHRVSLEDDLLQLDEARLR